MYNSFRQGIIAKQLSPAFLSINGSSVDLNANNDPTIITFAFQSTDYLFTENESITSAWVGPFLNTLSYWLYWEINQKTGLRSFGYTTIDPTGYGNTLPLNPLIGEHFFLYNANMMQVWDGNSWNPVLRIFAGQMDHGALILYSVGSQVNLLQGRNQGFIVFDQTGSPFKNNMNYFLTTETILNVSHNPLNNYKIEAIQVSGSSSESIPKYSAITWKDTNQLGLASYTDYTHPVIGISVEDMSKGQIKKFQSDGYLINNNWNFSDPPNTSIWVGLNGEITTTVPRSWSMQKLGFVINSNTIFLKIEDIILLGNEINFPTPTPSQTVTATITRTPTITPTNTATLTPSVTITLSPTSSATPTLTATSSLTRTMTPTITITPTGTPTNTPTNTTTPSSTVTFTPSSTITPTVTLTPIPTSTPTLTPTLTITPTMLTS